MKWLRFLLLPLMFFSCTSKPPEVPQYLYKIMTTNLWNKSRGEEYLSLGEEDRAFIHLAEKEDIERIIAKFFPDEPSIVILTLDPVQLEGNLVKEKNPGGNTEYFHLYNGSIPMTAIKAIETIEVKSTDN